MESNPVAKKLYDKLVAPNLKESLTTASMDDLSAMLEKDSSLILFNDRVTSTMLLPGYPCQVVMSNTEYFNVRMTQFCSTQVLHPL